MFSFFGGGHGAYFNGDGLNHGNAPISTATIPPLEILESAYPIVFKKWALREDSGGAGEFRGGLGAIYEIQMLENNSTVSLFGERGKFPPRGIAGGEPALENKCTFYKSDKSITLPLISKGVGITLNSGETVKLETPGGGGYGNPLKRSVDRVCNDVSKRYISIESAKYVYGVIINAEGKLDNKRTEKLRLEHHSNEDT